MITTNELILQLFITGLCFGAAYINRGKKWGGFWFGMAVLYLLGVMVLVLLPTLLVAVAQ